MDDQSPALAWPIAAVVILIGLVTLLGAGVVLARLARTGTSPVAVALSEPTVISPARTPTMAVPTAPVAASGATSTPVVFSFATTTLGAGGEPAPAPVGGQPAANATQPAARTNATATGAGATEVSGVINSVDVNGTPQLLDHGVATPTPSVWWAQTGPVSADLASELGAAYERFWDTRAQVLLNLDPGPLSEVESGSWLVKDAAALDHLRTQRQPEQINVQHEIQILHATASDATIRDDYTSYIVPVDADTNTPLTPSPSGTSHLIYHFQKVSGTWKVVDAVQASQS